MIACTWFFTRVRCLTRWVRRSTSRRSIRVPSSATQVSGRKPAASSCARILASTLSSSRWPPRSPESCADRDHHPANELPQHRRDRVRVRRRLQRDLVIGPKLRCPRAKLLRPHADPAPSRHTPSSTTAICANDRCTSIPIDLTSDSPLSSVGSRNRRAEATETNSRSQRSSGHSQGRPSANASSQLNV